MNVMKDTADGLGLHATHHHGQEFEVTVRISSAGDGGAVDDDLFTANIPELNNPGLSLTDRGGREIHPQHPMDLIGALSHAGNKGNDDGRQGHDAARQGFEGMSPHAETLIGQKRKKLPSFRFPLKDENELRGLQNIRETAGKQGFLVRRQEKVKILLENLPKLMDAPP